MWQALAEVGLLALDFVYHRWIDPPPKPTLPPGQTIQVPITAAGSPISMVFGRVRVRSPVLVSYSSAQAYTGLDPSGAFTYALNMTFALGIPFTGSASNLWNMWIGDVKASLGNRVVGGPYPIPGRPVGGSNLSIASVGAASTPGSGPYCCGPYCEFLDGNSSQVLVDGSDLAQNETGQVMLDSGVSKDAITSYRGYMLATCYNDHPNAWTIGPNANVPSYSFEVSTYPLASLGPNGGKILDGTLTNGSYDGNAIDALYDIITGVLGKLGLSPSLIDIGSFIAAATTLYNEGHGYSRAFEGGKSARETIQEILRQIDATLYTNPATGLITIKLIRPDYNPQTIPQITPDNCKGLQQFSLGSWGDAPNAVRVTFNDRKIGYNTNSAIAINGSNQITFGQRELDIDIPGCCNEFTAALLAARELAAQSRPIAKCSAIVNREFYNVCPGDVVSVTWPEANISGMMFRVAAVDRGTLANGAIRLDLIQDYFYQWRNNNPVFPGFPGGFTGSRSAE